MNNPLVARLASEYPAIQKVYRTEIGTFGPQWGKDGVVDFGVVAVQNLFQRVRLLLFCALKVSQPFSNHLRSELQSVVLGATVAVSLGVDVRDRVAIHLLPSLEASLLM
jgi:ABC-type lipoprotein release transport system permease subunit